MAGRRRCQRSFLFDLTAFFEKAVRDEKAQHCKRIRKGYLVRVFAPATEQQRLRLQKAQVLWILEPQDVVVYLQ